MDFESSGAGEGRARLDAIRSGFYRPGVDPAANFPPQLLEAFSSPTLLGEGAFGKVFRARWKKDGREVALKLLAREVLKDRDLLARLHREVQVASQLRHPRLVACLGANLAGEAPFLALEYLPGGDLGERIRARGSLPLETVQGYLLQILEGLEVLHARGLVHRDLKPANVLFRADDTLALADFGLVHAEGAKLTKTGMILGSPAYMHPDQIEGRSAEPSWDLYALGIMAYELLTGELPFEASDLGKSFQAKSQIGIDSRALSRIPPQVSLQVFKTWLSADPKARPGDLVGARSQIEALSQTQSTARATEFFSGETLGEEAVLSGTRPLAGPSETLDSSSDSLPISGAKTRPLVASPASTSGPEQSSDGEPLPLSKLVLRVGVALAFLVFGGVGFFRSAAPSGGPVSGTPGQAEEVSIEELLPVLGRIKDRILGDPEIQGALELNYQATAERTEKDQLRARGILLRILETNWKPAYWKLLETLPPEPEWMAPVGPILLRIALLSRSEREGAYRDSSEETFRRWARLLDRWLRVEQIPELDFDFPKAQDPPPPHRLSRFKSSLFQSKGISARTLRKRTSAQDFPRFLYRGHRWLNGSIQVQTAGGRVLERPEKSDPNMEFAVHAFRNSVMDEIRRKHSYPEVELKPEWKPGEDLVLSLLAGTLDPGLVPELRFLDPEGRPLFSLPIRVPPLFYTVLTNLWSPVSRDALLLTLPASLRPRGEFQLRFRVTSIEPLVDRYTFWLSEVDQLDSKAPLSLVRFQAPPPGGGKRSGVGALYQTSHEAFLRLYFSPVLKSFLEKPDNVGTTPEDFRQAQEVLRSLLNDPDRIEGWKIAQEEIQRSGRIPYSHLAWEASSRLVQGALLLQARYTPLGWEPAGHPPLLGPEHPLMQLSQAGITLGRLPEVPNFLSKSQAEASGWGEWLEGFQGEFHWLHGFAQPRRGKDGEEKLPGETERNPRVRIRNPWGEPMPTAREALKKGSNVAIDAFAQKVSEEKTSARLDEAARLGIVSPLKDCDQGLGLVLIGGDVAGEVIFELRVKGVSTSTQMYLRLPGFAWSNEGRTKFPNATLIHIEPWRLPPEPKSMRLRLLGHESLNPSTRPSVNLYELHQWTGPTPVGFRPHLSRNEATEK